MISGVAFVVIAALCCGLSVMAVLGVAELRMSGPDAIERDGLARGVPVPRWSLPDAAGESSVSSPPSKPFQLIMFTDHSLKSFPSIVDGLRDLLKKESVEVIILLDKQNDTAEAVFRILGLDSITVVAGSRSLYGRYNVRVTPWVIIADEHGRARASSLVNHAWQIAKLWELARIPLARQESSRQHRSTRHRIQAMKG